MVRSVKLKRPVHENVFNLKQLLLVFTKLINNLPGAYHFRTSDLLKATVPWEFLVARFLIG